jgi:hypothetical protein
MNVVMDCGLLVLHEYEFIHHHCTSWILQLLNNLKKKKLFDTHVWIMHYALHHIQMYLVIHYITLSIILNFIYLVFKKNSKEDKMQIESLFLIVIFLNWWGSSAPWSEMVGLLWVIVISMMWVKVWSLHAHHFPFYCCAFLNFFV